MMNVFTIGVYNSTEQQFFQKLQENNIDTLCDIRQRRAVRGKEYAFVNSTYLQAKLAEMGIKYLHKLELAPTKEIREKQKAEDVRLGEVKRSRKVLGEVFAFEYKKQILSHFDFDTFVTELNALQVERIAFLCVEEYASACHRSLVAEKLQNKYHFEITHL